MSEKKYRFMAEYHLPFIPEKGTVNKSNPTSIRYGDFIVINKNKVHFEEKRSVGAPQIVISHWNYYGFPEIP